MTRYAVTYEILFDNSWSGLECGASARFVRGGEYYLNYITVPIYWRVQTKYVNISLGIDLSFIINNGEGDKEYDRYDEDGEDAGINRLVLFETIINSGLVLKVGFPIRITKKFTIEPELNVSAYLYGVYFGVGLCFKIPMR